jgi:Putative restriction endonuclease
MLSASTQHLHVIKQVGPVARNDEHRYTGGRMSTSTAVPVEEYLRTSYDPDMEYVDGQLVERHVGEYHHSRIQALIIAMLAPRERERRFRIFAEQRVKISDEPRYRIPDLCVKAWPHQVTPILERPDLLIEVLSPDDRPGELLERIGDYQAAGIPHIWIVDPYKKKAFDASGGAIHMAAMTLETELVGTVDFQSLFAQLAEPGE